MLELSLLLLSAVGGAPDVLEERCDLIELNHFFDDAGRHVFDQVIFYDWDPRDCRFVVRDWRMVAGAGDRQRLDPRSVNWRVTEDLARGLWRAIGRDQSLLREVRSGSFRETWTQHDPELLERDLLPKELRRGLRQPPGKSIAP